MVSINPSPPNQDLYEVDPFKMELPGLDSLPPAATMTATAENANTNVGLWSEDGNRKVRKPYTITKSRESWTEQEHDKFLEALQLFDRDWKKIEAYIGSKTVIQIRSHAQKYFLKVQKSGTSEHVPPPRPKRKAAHPYPQKAPKNAVSQVTGPFQSSPALLEPGYVLRQDLSSVPRNPISTALLSTQSYDTVPPAVLDFTKVHNSCTSSTESSLRISPTGETNDQRKRKRSKIMKVMPDFAQVYRFIGTVFDPNEGGHLQKLKEMDPINLETVLVLMKNLSVNLMSPEFEDHRRLLSSYDVDAGKVKFGSPISNFHGDRPENAIPSV